MFARSKQKRNNSLIYGGAVVALAAFCIGSDVAHERAAHQMLRRVGGSSETGTGWSRGRMVRAVLVGTSPTAEDLSTLVPLRSLQVVDLSMTRIGDRELLALVGCRATTIVVPHGRTSERARAQFSEGRIAIGLGLPGRDATETALHRNPPPGRRDRFFRSAARAPRGADRRTIAAPRAAHESPVALSRTTRAPRSRAADQPG